MIQLKDITVMFNQGTVSEAIVLQDINLQIQPADFIILIGGNGAGKSTLLNLIAGEIYPTRGQILFDGQDLSYCPVIKRSPFIARVFQDPRAGTCETLTIEENLAFAVMRGQRRGVKLAVTNKLREEFRMQLAELNMGLEQRLSARVGDLSGGQRQALSLMMATLQPAKILLLDEPTAALDQKTATLILDITQRIIAQRQLTAIMITHHLRDALTLGNRSIILQEGKLVQDLDHTQRKQLNLSDLVGYL